MYEDVILHQSGDGSWSISASVLYGFPGISYLCVYILYRLWSCSIRFLLLSNLWPPWETISSIVSKPIRTVKQRVPLSSTGITNPTNNRLHQEYLYQGLVPLSRYFGLRCSMCTCACRSLMAYLRACCIIHPAIHVLGDSVALDAH